MEQDTAAEIDLPFDGQKKLRYPLGLIYYHRPLQAGDKSLRVLRGRRKNGWIIQRKVFGRIVFLRHVLNKAAFLGLPCPYDESN